MAYFVSKNIEDFSPYFSNEEYHPSKVGWIMKEHGCIDSLITIIRPATRDKNKIRYVCKCECGNYFLLRSEYTSITKSCGCLQKHAASRFGKLCGANNFKKHNSILSKNALLSVDDVYGELTITHINIPDVGRVCYTCLCSCGNSIDVLGKDLKSRKINSCGCVKSKGEKRIREILTQYHVNFNTEVTFDGLVSDKNAPLRYDFVIYKDCNKNNIDYIIEYHGEQHYQQSNKWHTERQQLHDKIKINFCVEHNIPLIIIPYTDFNIISMEYIIGKYQKIMEDYK